MKTFSSVNTTACSIPVYFCNQDKKLNTNMYHTFMRFFSLQQVKLHYYSNMGMPDDSK